MGKVINKGWKKDSDPFYREGWTLSVTLGMKLPSNAKDPQATASSANPAPEGALQGTQKKRGQNKMKSGLPWGAE